MKKILCFGDSNTFGFNPSGGTRYDEKTRWSGILKSKLKNSFEITEEGANNRTGFADNPAGEFYSSQKYLPKLLNRLGELEFAVISVGTNDLQFQYRITEEQIEKGLENLIILTKNYAKKIIVIPPVILDENILNGFFKIMFDKSGIEKSKDTGEIFRNVAKKYNCMIFDINEFTKPSETDGLHYSEKSHKIIAERLYNFILLNN